MAAPVFLARKYGVFPGEWCALQVLNLPIASDNERLAARDTQIDSPNSGLSLDLRRVVDAWPDLSQALQDAILAIVNAATKKEGR
jgi:hypothetical protein